MNFSEIFTGKNIYITGLILVALFVLFKTLSYLRKVEGMRLKSLRKKDLQEAVETETPEDEAEKIAFDRGASSLEQRFANIRKLLIPSIIGLVVFLAGIPFLGKLSASYISLLVGSFTVIVGLAAKPFIENLIAGIVLSIGQPIRIGDTVTIAGHYGTVEKIDLLYSTIKIWNWRRYVIPNDILLKKEFENHTLHDSNEWVKVEFWVAPTSDIELVESLAVKSMQSSDYWLAEVEAPTFWVMGMEKEAVRCWVAGWADSPASAWALADETRKSLIKKLNSHGLSTNGYWLSEGSHHIAEQGPLKEEENSGSEDDAKVSH